MKNLIKFMATISCYPITTVLMIVKIVITSLTATLREKGLYPGFFWLVVFIIISFQISFQMLLLLSSLALPFYLVLI